jgi:hypothetical protein
MIQNVIISGTVVGLLAWRIADYTTVTIIADKNIQKLREERKRVDRIFENNEVPDTFFNSPTVTLNRYGKLIDDEIVYQTLCKNNFWFAFIFGRRRSAIDMLESFVWKTKGDDNDGDEYDVRKVFERFEK